ncbi:MAG: glycosyltransferase family 4 protein [Endomicrobiia bacterium]|nr:glycosyltransferase family 4 protein [Endomicrobiia bacterium]
MKNSPVVFFDATPSWSGGANRILFLAREIRKSGGRPFVVCLPDGRLGELADGEGIETFKIKPLFDIDPLALARLFFYLRKIKAAVIDLNSPGFYWLGLIAGKLSGAKVILTRNVPYRKTGLKKLINKYLLYRRCDRVISLSAAVKKDLDDDYGLDRVELIYDGIFGGMEPPSREAALAARKTFGFGADDIVFGLVGRLEKNKGQHIAIEAFALMAGAVDRARLLVAGGGSGHYVKYLRDIVRRKGLDGKVALAGYVGDVSTIYAAMDILVHPSFYDNIPISILEAFGASRPVIASRVGGIPEAVEDGVNGMLFSPGDAGDLADKMVKMAASDYASVGRAAARLAAERFSADKMKSRYMEIIGEMVGEKE